MSSFNFLTVQISASGAATVTLNRPDVHNALNDGFIAELTHAFTMLGQDPEVRFAVLKGSGKSFCAGADLQVMKETKSASFEANQQKAVSLARMFETINQFSKPLLGVVHGAALGGGIGMVSVCDYVVASANAQFGLTEVRLGIVPAVISPYVMAKIGESNARAYFLSGERFSAERALAMHLIHEVVVDDVALQTSEQRLIAEWLKAAPGAMQTAKKLIHTLPSLTDPAQRMMYTSELIARARIADEGQEGMDAFLNKRTPRWVNA